MDHIIALSGGKDSTALALEMQRRHPDLALTFVCTPTGDELPDMVRHWDAIEARLGQPIIRVGDVTFHDLVREQEMLPNWRARFCTRMLKIEPFQSWLLSHRPATVYVGLRADEEEREGAIYDMPDVSVAFPLRDWEWAKADVWAFLDREGVSIPRRTDCARCFFQTMSEWWQLWKYYPDIYADASEDERYISMVRSKVCTYRSAKKDNWPTSLADLAKAFEAGRIPRNKRGIPANQLTALPADRNAMCSWCAR